VLKGENMTRKIWLILGSLALVLVFSFTLQNKTIVNSVQNNKPTGLLEQKVRLKSSSISKAPLKQGKPTSKTLSLLKSPKELQKEIDIQSKNRKRLTQKILELQELGELNQSFEQSLIPALEAQGIKSDRIKQFVSNYNFNTKFKDELNQLHQEDLYALLELLEHPLTDKLKSLEEGSQVQFAKMVKNGESFSLDPEKKVLIEGIMNETNSLEQTESVLNSLFSVTYSAAMQSDTKKTAAEIRSEASQLASKMTAAQMPSVKKIFELTYSNLSYDELDEYHQFMQKSHARRATEVSLNTTQKVLSDFLFQFTTMLIEEKKTIKPKI
tara:strand:+ start:18333 stop:19310 length:978 start_codon:yes stop_codon:yes gene_type:complete